MSRLPTVLVLGPRAQKMRINQHDFNSAIHRTWERAEQEAETLAARPVAELRAMARARGLAAKETRGLDKHSLCLRLVSATPNEQGSES